MKSFRQIQQAAEKGDFKRVAEITRISRSLVRLIIDEKRTDHHNVQRVFSDLLESREKLHLREANRRAKMMEA